MSKPDFSAFRFRTRTNFAFGTDTRREFRNAASHLMNASGKAKFTPSFSTNLDAARTAADQSTVRWKAGATAFTYRRNARRHQRHYRNRRYANGTRISVVQRLAFGARSQPGVAALREAGAVILGKTVTTEFAAVDPGPTRNPWDTRERRAAPVAAPLRPRLRQALSGGVGDTGNRLNSFARKLLRLLRI